VAEREDWNNSLVLFVAPGSLWLGTKPEAGVAIARAAIARQATRCADEDTHFVDSMITDSIGV